MKNYMTSSSKCPFYLKIGALLICFMFLSVQLFAQEITVKGKVEDKQQEALPGVNIIVKGTTVGTVTNIDGYFEIGVPSKDAILVFSSIGFVTTEIKVGSQKVINLQMKEDTELIEEVVVVGYGVQKKATVTGAVSAIKGDVIKKSGALNVTNSFAGQIPGVIATNRS